MGTNSEPLAIEGGKPLRPKPIQPAYHVSKETRKLIADIIDSGRFTDWYGGRVSHEFEREFCSAFGVNHAIAVNSGTSALHAAVVAAGIGPGDEVIVPAAAYISAASVVVQEKAIPVLCDIDENTFTISIQDLKCRITNKTRAIVVVHFWGCPADMDSIMDVARRYNLVVIEDCGQSHGSTVGRRVTGSIGDFGCFSFAPRKHIGTGEGGMVTCKTEEAAIRVRELVNKGKGPGWLDYHTLGYGYVMAEIAAAIGLDGLRVLDNSILCRRQAADVYRKLLANTPLRLPDDPRWGRHVYFKVPILLPQDMAQERDFIVDIISAENVSCRPTHPPMYWIQWLNKYAADMGHLYDSASFPITGRLLPRIFEVESGPNLTYEDMEVSGNAVLKAWYYVCRKVGHDPQR
jgi:perosamine synthetase